MIKLLAYADAGEPTGFERVMRGIMTHLHSTGKYDIQVRGIGYKGQKGIKYPFEVLPAVLDSKTDDVLGVYEMQQAIKQFQPDCMWILQDMWNITKYATLKALDLPLAVYYPVDTPNMKWAYAIGTATAASVAAYTDFGVQETAAGVQDFVDLLCESARMQNRATDEKRSWVSIPHPLGYQLHLRMDRVARYQNPDAYQVVPHGLDRGVFEVRDKQEARKRFGIPADAFVVGNVNANQFRKRLDLTLRSFAAFLERHNKPAHLVLHCAGHTVQGWDLEQLVRLYGLVGKVTAVHQQHESLTEDELVDLYNAFDVQINTAGGEGWGLTSFEGAACGVPQLVPDWSVTRTLWKDNGVLLPVRDYRMEVKFLNTAHCEVDVWKTAGLLKHLASHPDELGLMGSRALSLANAQPTWAQVGGKMEQVIQAAMAEPKDPTPITIDEIVAARKDRVQSEVATKPAWSRAA